MTDSTTAFDGAIPKAYDAYLGPVLFEPHADDLTRRTVAAGPARILEIACGTGILTERLCAALPEATVVASDISEDMLAFAQAKIGDKPGLTFGQADGGALPYPDDAFDAVICQFGVMFFPDKPQAMGEALRVLAPGGVLLFNTWGPFESNPLIKVAVETIDGFFDTEPPQFYKVPFGYHDVAAIEQLVSGAGFTDVAHERLAFDANPSAADAAHGLVHGNPTLTELQARGTADPDTAEAAVAKAIASALGDPVQASMDAIVFSARKPAAS
jgi:ubiquinone/menaquinone biosynthesis C-methylase UbiE